jgi:hypothetical protein
VKTLGYRLLAGLALLVGSPSFATKADECTPADQYRYWSLDVEGEWILMYATCILDSETNSYAWYYSNFDPKAGSNE